MTVRTGLFHYVPWASIDTFHRKGWMVVADLGLTHGQFCVLMWSCGCPTSPSSLTQSEAA